MYESDPSYQNLGAGSKLLQCCHSILTTHLFFLSIFLCRIVPSSARGWLPVTKVTHTLYRNRQLFGAMSTGGRYRYILTFPNLGNDVQVSPVSDGHRSFSVADCCRNGHKPNCLLNITYQSGERSIFPEGNFLKLFDNLLLVPYLSFYMTLEMWQIWILLAMSPQHREIYPGFLCST